MNEERGGSVWNEPDSAEKASSSNLMFPPRKTDEPYTVTMSPGRGGDLVPAKKERKKQKTTTRLDSKSLVTLQFSMTKCMRESIEPAEVNK